MNFKRWRLKTKEASSYCAEHHHLGGNVNSYRKMDCEECIWKAARKDLAEGILAEAKFWQVKVTAEKCLNDTIERLGKEARI